MTARSEASTGIHGADHALLQDMGREFADWVQALPMRSDDRASRWFPHAGAPNWLPPGWSEHARLDGYAPACDMYLLRRDAGGWALVLHYIDEWPRAQLYDSSATLRCLYATYRDQTTTRPTREPLTLWLGRTLTGLYDPAIEAEAAAQVIVALGGDAPCEPLAALLLPTL